MKRILVLLAVALLISGVAAAQLTKDPNTINTRISPPDFGALSAPTCNMNTVPIPDADSGVATDTITVGGSENVADLSVTVQIQHTWIGDVRADVTGPGCSSPLIFRIDLAGDGCCGCSGDDIDVVLSDAAGDSVENSCGSGGSGGAGGPWQPGDPVDAPGNFASCTGTPFNGDWTISITDGAAADTGSLLGWCVENVGGGGDGGDGGDGGGPVPAVGPFGIMALITLFLGISLFYMRRRNSQGA